MAENPIPLEELDDYLFGRLPPAARRRLEARLARDPDLRRQIRELEEGALALALAAPQLRPPREAWTKIQAGLAPDRQNHFLWPALPFHWLLKGWPLAGGLVAAVLIHLTLLQPGAPPPPAAAAGPAESESDQTAAVVPPSETRFTGRQKPNAIRPLTTAKTAPSDSLGSSLTGIGTPPGNQAALGPEAISGAPGNSHIGPPPARSRPPGSPSAAESAMTHPTVSTNSAAAPAPAPADAPSPVQIVYVQLPDPISALPSGMFMVLGNDGSALSTPLLAAGEAVSVFPSDADVVVAIDPAALPANGGPVTIWMEDADGNQTLLATFVPGPDPMFVIIQSGNLDAGIRYTVTISGTNVIGHYP